MKYETFAAFLISVALPTLAYPTGSSIAGLDAEPAIEQRDEGASIEQRDPILPPPRPYRGPLRGPGWTGPISDAIKPWPRPRPLPKVASRSDGGAEVERREPKRAKGKGKGNNNNNQQPAGPGKVETVTNVLNTAFPWIEMVNNPPQQKRSEEAEVERREPKRGKGKNNGQPQQQPGGPGKVETVTNVLNTAFPWVEMVNNQQQQPPAKRSNSDAEVEKREPKRGKGKGNNNNNNQQPGGPGKVETVTNVLNTAFPWVEMVNNQQQQQQPPAKRSEAIEQRAPKGPKGRPSNNNQQPGGPGKIETVTNVLNTAFPWVEMVKNQQQQQQPPAKRSEAIEQRAPKGPKGKPNNNNQQPGGPGKVETVTNVLNTAFPWVNMFTNPPPQKRSEAAIEQRAPKGPKGKPNNNNNNQQPAGPGKVETVTNVLNTAFPWVSMFTNPPPQKRSEAPSEAEMADMLEAAAAGYLNEMQAQVVRRAVVAAILA